MSGIEIIRTFSSIYEEFKLEEGDKNQRLRDKGDGLYVHEGRTDPAHRKEQKRKDGAQYVWNAIEAEYGSDVRDEVFIRVNGALRRDLGQELFRGDLRPIKEAIEDEMSLRRPQSSEESSSIGLPRETEPLPFKENLIDNQIRQKNIFSPSSGVHGPITERDSARDTLNEMFGFELTDDQIRALGGIPDPCHVEICATWNSGLRPPPDRGVTIRMGARVAQDHGFSDIQVTVYLAPSGKVNVYRESSSVRSGSNPPSGLGGCGLIRQIHMARLLGVNIVHNEASRSDDGSLNGYYTWARYGGDAQLLPWKVSVGLQEYLGFEKGLKNPDWAFDRVQLYEQDQDIYPRTTRENFVDVIGKLSTEKLSVKDLMATPEGRAFWRVFGFSIPLTFDLTKGSWSMSTLCEYGGEKCCFDLEGVDWK